MLHLLKCIYLHPTLYLPLIRLLPHLLRYNGSLFGYGQSVIDEVYKQRLVEQYIKEHGQSNGGVTDPPTVHAQDNAEVTLESEFTDSSDHVSLDQSNNGFSLVKLHWASFSTGLSSVLAVVLVGLAIASCCYLRGRRQRQTRFRHSELLHALSSATTHVSSPVTSQSGVHPGSSPRNSSSVDPSSVKYPVARFAAASPVVYPIARIAPSLSLIHISSPRDRQKSRMPSSA